MTVTNKILIQEEIKRRLNSGNACYYSVQNLLSSHLLSKNVKIYETIMFPVVLYGCETWSLTLREEHRLRVFENRVLRRIFGPERAEVAGGWRKLHNEELCELYSSPSIIRIIKLKKIDEWAICHEWGKRGRHITLFSKVFRYFSSVKCEVLTICTMKNTAIWDITLCAMLHSRWHSI
jgi:hypothetical protein